MDEYKEMLIKSISELEKIIDATSTAWSNKEVGFTSLWTLTDLRTYKRTEKILRELLDEHTKHQTEYGFDDSEYGTVS